MATYAVALSGGVDSSTTAALLLDAGYEVFGVTMLTQASGCQEVIDNASNVAKQLGIQHYVYDVIDEFKREVIDYFINSYLNGTTPNPCAICNKKIKLNKLLTFAREHSADYLATGHYASIEYLNNNLYLKESKNTLKDQSYFLSLTSKDCLKYVKTPLSNITNKSETRELARKFGLRNFQVKDSQDICFIKNNDYISFITNHVNNETRINKAGNIILKNCNTIIAQHKGLIHYTVGQRRGLGIPYSEPLYVTNIECNNNTVTVGTREDLIINTFKASQCNWLLDIIDSEFECFVKVRAGSRKYKTIVQMNNLDSIIVNLLEENITAICPGQVCALYTNDNVVIGAGIIEKYN